LKIIVNHFSFFLANFPSEVIETLPKEMETGIYYGFANVDRGPVYKMVMSIGWNPYFKNVKKSMVQFRVQTTLTINDFYF